MKSRYIEPVDARWHPFTLGMPGTDDKSDLLRLEAYPLIIIGVDVGHAEVASAFSGGSDKGEAVGLMRQAMAAAESMAHVWLDGFHARGGFNGAEFKEKFDTPCTWNLSAPNVVTDVSIAGWTLQFWLMAMRGKLGFKDDMRDWNFLDRIARGGLFR